jgi:DNA-binding beta-propeller fold protein YncE
VTHRVFTFNGRSSDSTAIDAKTGDVLAASIPMGGKPEFAQVDGKGHVYANIEDKNEIVEVDAKNNAVAKRYSIAPCDGPSGLAIDPKKLRLYSVCGNKMMVVSDPVTGTVLASPAAGAGMDGVAFDDGYAFSANGGDGTITMIGETAPGNQKAHKLYLPTAEFGPPPPPAADGKRTRPQPLPDSFQIIVVGR